MLLIRRLIAGRLGGEERGSILILSVLSALIIVGSAGLAVDVGRLYATKAELGRAVDAAALAGVLEFDGSTAGLTSAGNKAEAYLLANETLTVSKSTTTCTLSVPSAACVVADGSTSTLRINARKQTRLYFLPIFGINTATVSAKATAGFNDQTLDAVMVIDATFSMYGTPFNNAKTASINFKNTLLGTNPSGNVAVGVTPLRGCYKPTPITLADCIDNSTQVKALTSDSPALTTHINSLTASTATTSSATNVCTGLGKGYQTLVGSGSHSGSNNRKFLVLLSDGDNVYFGDNVYSPTAYPFTYTVPAGGTNYACQPPNTCAGWGTPCHNGTYTSGAITLASDDFNTNNFTGGTGWVGSSWTTTATANTTAGTSPQGAAQARVAATGTIARVVNLSSVSAATLNFVAKIGGSWTSTDRAYAEASTDGIAWTTLATYTSGSPTSYGTPTSITLSSSFIGQSSAHIRFRANTGGTTRYLYVDSITVRDPNTDATGYLNGRDGQDYASCTEIPKPRERQLDVQTLNLANAIK